MTTYPEPRYPSYIFQEPTDEELERLATQYVQRSSNGADDIRETFNHELTGSEDVLIITYPDQNQRIADATASALEDHTGQRRSNS